MCRHSLHRLSTIVFAFLLAIAPIGAIAQSTKGKAAEKTIADITAMLTTFLSPSQNGTAAAHDRFWADDLIYTTSGGVVKTKPEIMKSFAEKPAAGADKSAEPATEFSAEDVLVRPYGRDMAALTFRLVARDADGKTSYYRNSGTFLFRHGKWQVITWQATKSNKPA